MRERNYVRVGPFDDLQRLAELPGYEQTREIASLDASELTQEGFLQHCDTQSSLPAAWRGARLARVRQMAGSRLLQARLEQLAPGVRPYARQGLLAFLTHAGVPRAYAPYSAILYRGSYSDWRLHAADEMLLTQVVGTKEVLILPPEDVSWRALKPPGHEPSRLLDVDLRQLAKAAQLTPITCWSNPATHFISRCSGGMPSKRSAGSLA